MNSMKQLDLIEVNRYPRDRVQLLLDIAEKQGLDIQIVEGYAEPDYPDRPLVLGDWNDIRTYKPGTCEVVSRNTTPSRLAILFEKLGYEVEWGDEWITCQGCYEAIRYRGDSYSWTPHYWIDDVHNSIECFNCMIENPCDYIDYLNSHSDRCCMLDALDLTKYGYKLHSDDYENGWNPGQNADPKEITLQLKKEGITDFIFKLDGKGQFGINFSVWVKR